jgi:hypothetical protein
MPLVAAMTELILATNSSADREELMWHAAEQGVATFWIAPPPHSAAAAATGGITIDLSLYAAHLRLMLTTSRVERGAVLRSAESSATLGQQLNNSTI